MEAKHTPGPWRWSDFPRASDGGYTWSLIGQGGYGILSCDGEGNSPQGIGDYDNARLIAAAPELLEAAQRAADRFGLWEAPTAGMQDALDGLKAAITKATGADQ